MLDLIQYQLILVNSRIVHNWTLPIKLRQLSKY